MCVKITSFIYSGDGASGDGESGSRVSRSEIYKESGLRTMERGNVSAGRKSNGENYMPKLEFGDELGPDDFPGKV